MQFSLRLIYLVHLLMGMVVVKVVAETGHRDAMVLLGAVVADRMGHLAGRRMMGRLQPDQDASDPVSRGLGTNRQRMQLESDTAEFRIAAAKFCPQSAPRQI
jgi:hypothetical protein